MKMVFLGRKEYGARMLEWSVGQGIDVIAVCSDSDTWDNPVVYSANKLDIPVVPMEEAEEMRPDIAVSYLFPKKIRKPLIATPSFGCINFHPAILPDWRGTAGYNIAILNRLSEWGATAHYVDENIDTGAIIRIYRFSFDYRYETAASLERKTQMIQMDLYRSVLTDVLEKGRLEAQKQLGEQGRYVSRKEMEQMKKVDLEFDKDDLDLKIRAFWFPPYDGAFVEAGGKKYTLVNKEILESLAKHGTGGGYHLKQGQPHSASRKDWQHRRVA